MVQTNSNVRFGSKADAYERILSPKSGRPAVFGLLSDRFRPKADIQAPAKGPATVRGIGYELVRRRCCPLVLRQSFLVTKKGARPKRHQHDSNAGGDAKAGDEKSRAVFPVAYDDVTRQRD